MSDRDDAPGADFGPSAPPPAGPRYSLPERALIAVCLTMFGAMILATLGQILFRYVLEISVTWTEEAARALFVLAMVMSMAFAYREKEHIIVDFLFMKLSPGAQRWLGLAFNVFILMFLAFWLRGAWTLMGVTWGSSLITIPWFSTAYFYLWEVAAIALMFAYVLRDTLLRVSGEGGAIGRDVDT